MRHKLSTIVYTQGWLGTQFEAALEAANKQGDQNAIAVAEQVKTQWALVDEAIDDLIKIVQEQERQLTIIRSAFPS